MAVVELVSERRKRKIAHENFVHTYSKRTKDEEHGIWVCEKRSMCCGRVWTDGIYGPVAKVIANHNHPADAAHPAALQAIEGYRVRAETTQEEPQQIVTETVAGLHRNIAAQLPQVSSIKRTIRNIRDNDDVSALPQNLQELKKLVIPQAYQEMMIDGNAQQFLMFDSMDEMEAGRMLVFSTALNLHLLSQSRDWFADGTFSSTPGLFKQLYTIHVIQFNHVVPVIYALLPNKTRETYCKLLHEIKALQSGLQLQTVMTDFEQATMQAFDIEFPRIVKTRCFFYLTQNMWKRVQKEGMQVQYQENYEFAVWIRMITSLAFVPPENVVEAFDALTDHQDFPPVTDVIADYFKANYSERRRRRPPLFPVDLWNVYPSHAK